MTRVLLALVPALLLAGPALADDGAGTTRDGKTLHVSKATGLRVDGERVRITGRGYDRSKGIYVAFCVDNGPGQAPTPCGGGADTEGRSGNSVWISDLPPAYGTGLAQPYGEGGSFDVTIHVRAQLNDEVDCRRARCAVVTRNDHTRSDDRSQDLAVPVTFGSAAAPAPVAPRPAATRSGGRSTGSVPATSGPSAAAGGSASSAATPSASASATGTALGSPSPLVAADEVAAEQRAVAPDAREGGSGVGLLVALAVLLAGAGGAVATRRALAGRRPDGTP